MAIPKNAIKVGTRQRRTLSRNEVAPAAYPMLPGGTCRDTFRAKALKSWWVRQGSNP